MSSNRLGQARSAYREVQERHEDIKRIERTLTELAQLFNDVRCCVLLQYGLAVTSFPAFIDERACRTTGRADQCHRDYSCGGRKRRRSRVCVLERSIFTSLADQSTPPLPVLTTPRRQSTLRGQHGRNAGSASSSASLCSLSSLSSSLSWSRTTCTRISLPVGRVCLARATWTRHLGKLELPAARAEYRMHLPTISHSTSLSRTLLVSSSSESFLYLHSRLCLTHSVMAILTVNGGSFLARSTFARPVGAGLSCLARSRISHPCDLSPWPRHHLRIHGSEPRVFLYLTNTHLRRKIRASAYIVAVYSTRRIRAPL